MYANINRSACRSLRVIFKITTNLSKQCNRNIHGRTITLDIDTLDNFTSQLLQRKTGEWGAQQTNPRLTKESNLNVTKEDCDHNIEFFSIERINSLFQDAIEMGDSSTVLVLIEECIKFRKCPSHANLIHALTFCAQNGDKRMVTQIDKLCEEFYPDVSRANSHFRHYLAEAIWVKGNITESLNIFKEVYRENGFLRRRIRLMFKYLILDVVSNRSEAALVNIVKFSQDLLEDFKDFFPITCTWQACFLSEWYTDQCLALDLLEQNDGLREAVICRIPYVVSISLMSHRTEVVYRLLEILLKYDMKREYGGVLLSLLDYQIRQGDLSSCNEIIQWSVENDVDLPTIHRMEFLNLLLNYKLDVSNLKDKWPIVKGGKFNTNFKF